jgi:hypothetical protein
MSKKPDWVKKANRRHRNSIRRTKEHFDKINRKKAISKIRRSWASPYSNSKNIPESVINLYK